MNIICVNCNRSFYTNDKRQKFCSHKCADTFNSNKRKSDWDKILDYYDEHIGSGETYVEMSKHMGCFPSTFRKVCVLNGRTKPQTRKQVEKENKRKLETRYCSVCKNEFVVPNYSNKKFCSDACQRIEGHRRNDIIRKRLKNKSVVDYDITLSKLFERDNGICQICGSVCDWNDYKYVNGKKHSSRMYPTIDHIKPLKNGGNHSWSNIQLAHLSCNSSKGAS